MSTYPATVKSGKRYLGNKKPTSTEVHDLQNEKPQCQIAEILAAGHGVGFLPDTIEEAHRCGFDNCAFCLGGSKR
jgi:hypothetical protein